MTDDTAARLRKLAEREVRDRHDAAQWCASHSERDDRDEWAYVSLMDLRNAVDGATILALLDERDALRRERDEAREAVLQQRIELAALVTEVRAERDALAAHLRAMTTEFRRVFPIYYYAEPWAHDRNEVLRAAEAALDGAKGAT